MKGFEGKMGWEYEPFEAVWEPHRTDDLKTGVVEWMEEHKPRLWEYLWFMGEEESSTYAGQWACGVYRPTVAPPFVWVPECELRIVEQVSA